MKGTLTLTLLILWQIAIHAQPSTIYQYFDGLDTSALSSITYQIDTPTTSNIWQVGPPQKTVFNSATTAPNVIVTDTINTYPSNNHSSFTIGFDAFSAMGWPNGIMAFRWKQKLDMDPGKDFGLVEFSIDNGLSWQNAFGNPYVYNFYGFNTDNVDTLNLNGQDIIGFTGHDPVWRDVWLCYNGAWLGFSDSIKVRYTFVSDSIDNQMDGWMLDNMQAHRTFIHTVSSAPNEAPIALSPNPTNGILNIEMKSMSETQLIDLMELVDVNGAILNSWKSIPSKFFIDLREYSKGLYFVRTTTLGKTNIGYVILE